MGSPRHGGNSDHLLDRALDGARSADAVIEKIVLIDLHIEPCRECGRCDAGESCSIDDDMDSLLARMQKADGLVVAAPLFFGGVPGHTKTMIDRCQPLWNERSKWRLGGQSHQRRAAMVCTGGASGHADFTGARLTLRAFFKTLGLAVVDEVMVSGLEGPDDVLSRPEALERAFWAGRRVASSV
jgi:multimeric flavodoxin WrbA